MPPEEGPLQRLSLLPAPTTRSSPDDKNPAWIPTRFSTIPFNACSCLPLFRTVRWPRELQLETLVTRECVVLGILQAQSLRRATRSLHGCGLSSCSAGSSVCVTVTSAGTRGCGWPTGPREGRGGLWSWVRVAYLLSSGFVLTMC